MPLWEAAPDTPGMKLVCFIPQCLSERVGIEKVVSNVSSSTTGTEIVEDVIVSTLSSVTDGFVSSRANKVTGCLISLGRDN